MKCRYVRCKLASDALSKHGWFPSMECNICNGSQANVAEQLRLGASKVWIFSNLNFSSDQTKDCQ